MADITPNCPTDSSCFKEAVCIDAGRVYDSCCDRDCITDMRVFFSAADCVTVNNAVSVKLRKATVADVNIDVEPVAFNKGYYSCDLTFSFLVEVDAYSEPHSCPLTLTGMCFYTKKAILYGSEGNIKTFTNEYSANEECCKNKTISGTNSPKCVVSCVEPIALSARLGALHTCDDRCCVPSCVCKKYTECIDFSDQSTEKAVYVTLGLFTVIQLIRNVQMLVPVYDFCIPENSSTDDCDSPCDVFKKIGFPMDDFFPPRPCDQPSDCDCE